MGRSHAELRRRRHLPQHRPLPRVTGHRRRGHQLPAGLDGGLAAISSATSGGPWPGCRRTSPSAAAGRIGSSCSATRPAPSWPRASRPIPRGSTAAGGDSHGVCGVAAVSGAGYDLGDSDTYRARLRPALLRRALRRQPHGRQLVARRLGAAVARRRRSAVPDRLGDRRARRAAAPVAALPRAAAGNRRAVHLRAGQRLEPRAHHPGAEPGRQDRRARGAGLRPRHAVPAAAAAPSHRDHSQIARSPIISSPDRSPDRRSRINTSRDRI